MSTPPVRSGSKGHVLVLAIDFYPNVGGIARYTHGLANGFVNAGADVTIVGPSHTVLPTELGPRYELIADPDSEHRLRVGPAADAEAERIGRFLDRLHRDRRFTAVVATHAHYYGRVATAFGRRHGIPVGTVGHGFEIREHLIGEALLEPGSLARQVRDVFLASDLVLPNSRYTSGLIRGLLDGDPGPMMVTGCGLPESEIAEHTVKSPEYDPEVRRARREERGWGAAPAFSFLGRLVPSKSVDTFVRAVAEADRAQGWVMGDGPQREHVERLAATLGVADRITFLGQVSEEAKWDRLHASDGLVLPSVELRTGAVEGFGIVLLEGAAAGAVPIGSDSGGIPDVLGDGANGHMVAAGDPSALSAALDRVIDEPDEAAELVERTRGRLADELHWDVIAERVLEALAARRPAAPQPGTDDPGTERLAHNGRVLVVSDAYPPRAKGGAEVSLAMTVEGMRRHGYIVDVAVLDRATATAERIEEGDAGDLFLVPFADRWLPDPREWPSTKLRRLFRSKPFLNRIAMVLAYLLRPWGPPRGERLKRAFVYTALQKTGKQGYVPFSDEDLRDPRAVKAVRSLLRTRDYDLVHADNYRSILVVDEATRGEGVPWGALIRDNRFYCAKPSGDAHIRGDACGHCLFECTKSIREKPLRSALTSLMADTMDRRRAILGRATAVAATSQYLEQQATSLLPPGHAVHRVRNPAGVPESVAAAQGGIDRSSPPDVLVVGMLGQNKGVLQLPDIAVRLREQVPDFTISLAGRGHLQRQIERRAAKLGVRDHFRFLGFLSRTEVYRAYGRASVVAIPVSWPEPFGRVPLEAGLSRRPVVAYATGGLVETIEDGVTGRLVPPGDREAFADAVADLLLDPDVSEKMGEAGWQAMSDQYSVARSMDELRDFWSSILARGR